MNEPNSVFVRSLRWYSGRTFATPCALESGALHARHATERSSARQCAPTLHQPLPEVCPHLQINHFIAELREPLSTSHTPTSPHCAPCQVWPAAVACEFWARASGVRHRGLRNPRLGPGHQIHCQTGLYLMATLAPELNPPRPSCYLQAVKDRLHTDAEVVCYIYAHTIACTLLHSPRVMDSRFLHLITVPPSRMKKRLMLFLSL